jgi:hypothetical protein
MHTRKRQVLTDNSRRRFGYPDEKVARLTREAIAQGFNHFKVRYSRVWCTYEYDL